MMEPMTEQRAREILGNKIEPDGGLCGGYPFCCWSPRTQPDSATLDGDFTADQLEAIAWWMRNKAAT